MFRFERTMDMGPAEEQLLTQLCAQLAFPRETHQLKQYLSGEEPSLIELFPELAAFRDIAYLTKARAPPYPTLMSLPSSHPPSPALSSALTLALPHPHTASLP